MLEKGNVKRFYLFNAETLIESVPTAIFWTTECLKSDVKEAFTRITEAGNICITYSHATVRDALFQQAELSAPIHLETLILPSGNNNKKPSLVRIPPVSQPPPNFAALINALETHGEMNLPTSEVKIYICDSNYSHYLALKKAITNKEFEAKISIQTLKPQNQVVDMIKSATIKPSALSKSMPSALTPIAYPAPNVSSPLPEEQSRSALLSALIGTYNSVKKLKEINTSTKDSEQELIRLAKEFKEIIAYTPTEESAAVVAGFVGALAVGAAGFSIGAILGALIGLSAILVASVSVSVVGAVVGAAIGILLGFLLAYKAAYMFLDYCTDRTIPPEVQSALDYAEQLAIANPKM